MKRRSFIQKTVITTGALAITANASATILQTITAEQNFNFMSQTHPNLTLIHDFFTAYGNNDLDGIKKVLDTDIKWHIPGKHPLSGTKTGVEDVLAFFKKLNKAAFKAEPIVMGVNDNYVIDCHRNWSTIPNEENLDAMSCLLWKIENNKIVEVFNFPQDQHIVDAFFTKLYK